MSISGECMRKIEHKKRIVATKVQIRANKPTNERTNMCINCMNERTKEWTSDHKTEPRKWPWTACSFTFVYEIETNANIPIKQNIWFWNKFALLVCWAIFSLLCKSVFLFNTQRVCVSVCFVFHLPLTSNVLYLALQRPFIAGVWALQH